MTPLIEPLATLGPEEQRLFAEIGQVWGRDGAKHSDLVRDAYRPLHAAADNSGIRVHRDLAYGPHERQVVDVYVPESGRATDVLVFVHGGAFIRGSKRVNDQMYDNVLYWFAKQGVAGINVEYRLASDAPYPQGAEDVGRAVEWTAENLGRLSADPQRLFVSGATLAGAAHVVGWCV